jgi:hypothetical protein
MTRAPGLTLLITTSLLGLTTSNALAKKIKPAPSTKPCPGALIGGCVHPYRIGSDIYYLKDQDIQALRQMSDQNRFNLQQQGTPLK